MTAPAMVARAPWRNAPPTPAGKARSKPHSRNLTVAGDQGPGTFQSQAQGPPFPLPLGKKHDLTGVRCVLGRPSFVLFSPFWSEKSEHGRQPWLGLRVRSWLEGQQSPAGAVGA